MSKKYLLIPLILILMAGATFGYCQFIYKKVKIQILEKDGIQIKLINPVDNRVLTKQGEDLLYKIIKEEKRSLYSTQDTHYSLKDKNRIESEIHLKITKKMSQTPNYPDKYIVPMKGKGFIFYTGSLWDGKLNRDKNGKPETSVGEVTLYDFTHYALDLHPYLSKDRNYTFLKNKSN